MNYFGFKISQDTSDTRDLYDPSRHQVLTWKSKVPVNYTPTTFLSYRLIPLHRGRKARRGGALSPISTPNSERIKE